MMVMVVAAFFGMLYMTLFVMALFEIGFDFYCDMADVVFAKFFAYFVFYFLRIALGNNMHCGIVVLPVHAPKMYVMNI